MNPTDYPFEVRPLAKEEGGGYLITFPDLPGCMSDGETPEEAIANGLDAAKSWLATAKEFKDPISPGRAILQRQVCYPCSQESPCTAYGPCQTGRYQHEHIGNNLPC